MGLIFSGAFDRYPKLRLVIGHLGEGMPTQIYRFDWMQSNADGVPGLRDGQPAVTLKHPVSHYFRNNIWITTSGVGWEPAITFCMETMGADRVLYAMDYPYQQSSDEVAVYDRLAISDAHKKMLMQENAEAVFRLVR
jgi:predicted TIM-barrel fold metal-dependent hydrolase